MSARLWLRPVLARPLRFLGAVAGVALGVASVESTLLASRAAVASLGEDVEALAGAATLEIRRPGGVPLDLLAPLRGLCGRVLLVPVVEGLARAPALGERVRVLGVDLLAGGLPGAAPLADDAGARDALLLRAGALLPESLARELGARAGDALELVVDARPRRLEVARVFAPERLPAAWERTVVVDVALAQELFARAEVDRVEVVPRAGERGPAAQAALAAELALHLPAGTRVAPVSERRAEGERAVRALRFNLAALAGVSLLVAGVLVATTLATSLVQRRRALALLRSLGASRGQLARAVLAEAAAIGALGGALGVAGGWLAARAALAGAHATYATLVPALLPGRLDAGAGWIVLGLALGVVTSLAAASLPLAEALAVPPLQHLRREHPLPMARAARARSLGLALVLALAALALAALPPRDERPLGALSAAACLLSLLPAFSGPLVELAARARARPPASRLGAVVRLAQAALGAGRRRAAWAAGAIGVAVGLAVAMTAMIGSFRRSVVEWTEQTMRSDLFVRPLGAADGGAAGGLDPEVERVARALFGASAVDAYRSGEAWVDGRAVELGGADFAVRAARGGVPFQDGRPSDAVFAAALAAGGAVVSEPFARRFGVARGARVALATPAGTIERVVEGVYRDYSGSEGRVVLDRGDFLAHYPARAPQSLSVFLPDGADAGAARRALEAALGGRFALEVRREAEVRRDVLAVFDRTFAVTVALRWIAVAVAALAVVGVLGALVRERRRDLSVVRTLGGSPAQLAGAVLGQALALGAIGALGGLAAGLAVGWVLVAVVNVQSFGWSLRFAPPWGALLGTVAWVLPACLAAALLPALAALGRARASDLREEL